MMMRQKAVWAAALLLVGTVAYAKNINVTIMGLTIPGVTGEGQPDNENTGLGNWKVRVNSNTGAFTAKLDKGTAPNVSLSKKKPKFTVPFSQEISVPGFGTVTASGSANLEYNKPKVKKGVITNSTVKVKGNAAGNVAT